MRNIEEIEKGILIETDDFNYSVGNVVNEIMFRERKLDEKESCRIASEIIKSMVERKYVKVIKTKYKKEEEDLYSPISSADLTAQELELFFTKPERWEAMGIFSDTLMYELSITETGRKYLHEQVYS